MDYRTENGATLDYNYGSQPQAVTAVSGRQTFAYDANGQRVKTVQPDGRILYTPFPTYEEEVLPVAATTPIVTLTANWQTAVTIPPNTTFTLQWQASNAFACEAGGSWSGSKPLNGSQNFKGFNSGSRTYSLTCSNVSGSTSRSVTVQIGYGFDLPLAVVIVPLDGPTSGQTTIQRSTYSLAGQAIATRVNGDPEGHDGLYYLYSDHLGSASAIVTSGGQKVNETRYLPFGGYRSGGPNAITDRGFTGQKENMELGLLYYNARFYAPGLGRFLSADSIVPDPTNPQSLNRYSYVRNSPLGFTDPTGHRECDVDGNCGPPVRLPKSTPPKSTIPQPFSSPFFNFIGNITLAEKQMAHQAASDIAQRMAQEMGGLSALEAFLKVFGGPITIKNVDEDLVDAAGFEVYAIASETEALITIGNKLISNHYLLVHEIFHIFDQVVLGGAANKTLWNDYQNVPGSTFPNRPNLDGPSEEKWGFAGVNFSPWQKSRSGASGEEFADMGTGWTYNTWESSRTGVGWSPEGQARADFMTVNMDIWLNK